jgi:outer membrane protein TolC
MKTNTKTGVLLLTLVMAAAEAKGGELEGPSAPAPQVITLAEAQQLAVRRNPGSKNLGELVYQADMRIRGAWSLLLPHLSANGSVTRNQREVALEFPDFSAFDPADPTAPLPTSETVIQEQWGQSFGFTANMTLFDPRSIPLIKNTHDSADLARLTAKRRKNDLLYAVTAAYYQVHSMSEMIAAAEENLALAEELERVSTARVEAEQGTRIDILRAELQVFGARKELDNASDALQLAKSALAHLIGHRGDFNVAGPGRVESVEGDLGALTDRALADRVELGEAALAETIAARSKTETWMKWLPAFDVTYDWSWSSAEGFSGEHDQWMLIFGARWSLFEGGGRIAELKSRESQVRMARNDLEQAKLDIRADVEQAFVDVGQRQRNVELAEKQTALARENQRLVDQQYRAGIATSLDAQDAATELHSQRITRVLERLQYDIAQLALRRAVGEYHSLAAVDPR